MKQKTHNYSALSHFNTFVLSLVSGKDKFSSMAFNYV